MSERYEMRFTGSGGQGVILASVILAEAAVLSGIRAVQSQAYGPEARGGVSKAETILSREDIWFSRVVQPDFLLALTQRALEQFSGDLAPGAVVMADESLHIPARLQGLQVLSLPILRTARETVGREMTANIVAVGAVNAALGLFPESIVLEAALRHVPRGTEAINRAALAAGAELASGRQVRIPRAALLRQNIA